MKIKELINILELYNPEVPFNIKVNGLFVDYDPIKILTDELEVTIDIQEKQIPF